MHLDITDERSITRLVDHLHSVNFQPNLVINCSGVLHTNAFGPERSWRHFDIEVMRQVFDVNTFGVGLLGKHLIPLFARDGRSVFASLSARVGSISDNRLGGWYSYRASKSAQNMFIKGLAIEAARKWRELVCVALHPGTVDTALSQPFSSSVPPEKLFTTELACQHLSRVIEKLTAEDTGGFFAWDGQSIDY
jgi:NAD(P)-dependent dehydrogenase (short-subunit alcohol dehydrogenase family)